MSIRGKFTWLDRSDRVIEFPFGRRPCVYQACKGLPVNGALRRLLQSDVHPGVPGAVSSLRSNMAGNSPMRWLINFTWSRLSKCVLCWLEAKFWPGMCGGLCVCEGGLCMCSIYLFFFHALGQLAVSRLIAHLCCYSGNQAILAVSDTATLALRIHTSVLLRGTEANVFRGIFLPSEAFQLYWLIGLTNPVFCFFTAVFNIVPLSSWKSKQYIMYRAWLSRPADHLGAWWCLYLRGPIPHLLCSSEFKQP